jgi:alpha-tubulin suppressor-like RCC1 family protein
VTKALNSRVLTLWALAAVTVATAAVTLVACGSAGGGAPIADPISLDSTSPSASSSPTTTFTWQPNTIAAGPNHSCALVSNGIQTAGSSVACWGKNGNDGSLGNDSTLDSKVPVTVQGLNDAIAVAVGGIDGRGTSCAVRAGGKVMCWGSDRAEQLGDGASIADFSRVPVEVSGLTDAIAVVVGTLHACALRRAIGVDVYCWGVNEIKQFGLNLNTGNLSISEIPVRVAINSSNDGVALSGGSFHTCVLDSADVVRCWGADDNSQIGTAMFSNGLVPTVVRALATILL